MTRALSVMIAILACGSVVSWNAPAVAGPSTEPDRDLPRTSPVSHPVRGGYLSAKLVAVRISDPARYHLRPAPPGYAWVIVGHDILLIQEKSGLIVDLIEGGAR